jgi:hypothetical protein
VRVPPGTKSIFASLSEVFGMGLTGKDPSDAEAEEP